MQIVVCVSLLVVYGRLYSVVGDCQLNVEERQFKLTDALQHRHALFVLFRNGVYRWLIDTEGSLIYLSASFELLSSLLR